MKSFPILPVTLVAAIGWLAFVAQPYLPKAVADDAASPADTPPDEAAGEPSQNQPRGLPLSALELLQRAREALVYERTSVSATLRERVAIGGSAFEAAGTYEAGSFPRLRLSIQLSVGSSKGRLLEVCDGQLLWTVQEIDVDGSDNPNVKISRTVIADVLNAWEANIDSPEAVLTSKLGVGGLPALLAALERSMVFDAVKTDVHSGQPYAVIQGRWNEEFLSKFGGGNGKPLPDYVPDRVRVYFDQKTLFPTRILYLKKAAETNLPYRLLLSFEFSDIVLDGPVDDEKFRYVPPDEFQVENRTSKILGLIDAAKKQPGNANSAP